MPPPPRGVRAGMDGWCNTDQGIGYAATHHPLTQNCLGLRQRAPTFQRKPITSHGESGRVGFISQECSSPLSPVEIAWMTISKSLSFSREGFSIQSLPLHTLVENKELVRSIQVRSGWLSWRWTVQIFVLYFTHRFAKIILF